MTLPQARHLLHPRHVDRYAATLQLGVEHLVRTLSRQHGPSTGADPETLRRRVARVDLDRPLGDLDAALAELDEVYLRDAIWFHDPGYAAHLNCPVLIPAVLAELVAATVNTSMDTFDQSAGATFVERAVVDWTARRLGLGERADGIVTGGGTQSNLHALWLAREHSRAPRGRARVLASADAHFSVQRAARLLGLGADAVAPVPVDGRRRMSVPHLRAELDRTARAGLIPVAVVATAGTTDAGAIDPLPQVAAAARAHGAWLHVDAAYGGGLITSARHRHLLTGIEQADSVALDYHKTFFQPVPAGALLVREGDALRGLAHHADYLNPAGSGRPDQVDKSIQTTRRFDALKVWLTLRTVGPDTLGAYLDTVVDLAAEVAQELAAQPDVELAVEPALSTVLFRFRPAGSSEDEADALVPRARQALYRSGRGMVAATVLDGRRWLKLTLLNPMTTPAEVLALVARLRSLAGLTAPAPAGVA